MAIDVQTPVYEGPFDLLLHLILKEQVDLYEVNLSTIVDAFLAELDRIEHLDLEIATEFLLIAATLVELKARRLLPEPDDVDLDEELGLWEERDLLLSRLLECKTFKDVANVLADLQEVAGSSYPRRVGPEEHFLSVSPDLLAGVTPEQVRAAYLRAVEPKPVPRVQLDHVAPVRISVAEAVIELADELSRLGTTITFRRLTDGFVERLDVIVRFLAVLEMYKQGLVDIDQAEAFGDIQLRWIGEDADLREVGLVDAYDG